MKTTHLMIFVTIVLVHFAADHLAVAQPSWPQFRGPSGDGIAADQNPPLHFGPDKNQTWAIELPGRGWSSPVIEDGRIWLTTAIEQIPSEEERLELLRKTANDENKFGQLAIAQAIELKLLCVDLQTGLLLRTIDLASIRTQMRFIHSTATHRPRQRSTITSSIATSEPSELLQ